jgi:hypothetical protein
MANQEKLRIVNGIRKALADNVPDDQIIEHLKSEPSISGGISAALSDGVDAGEILNHLGLLKDRKENPYIKADPTEGMSGTDKFLSGAGKAFVDIGRGAKQILAGQEGNEEMFVDSSKFPRGSPERQAEVERIKSERVSSRQNTQSEIDESRTEDAPLMSTGEGIAGNITGNIAAAAPALAIPGANTVVGSALVGGLQGAVQPVATGESRLDNTLTSAVAGGGTQAVLKTGGKLLANARSANQAKVAAQQAEGVTKNAVVEEAKGAGYVLPPTQANPSLLNRFLEGISGKIQTGQKASLKNQEVTNNLVRQALGLSEDAPITPAVLSEMRENAGQAYQAIKDLGTPLRSTRQYRTALSKIGDEWSAASKEFPELASNAEIKTLVSSLSKQEISPEAAVEMIKKLRFDASSNLKNFQDPGKTALGFAQKKASNALEDLIENNLEKSGQGALVSEFKKARELIAKSHAVEDALNESTGNVSARYLGRLLDKGVPLSGELKTAARFARSFEKAAQDVEKIGSMPGFSPLDVAAGGIAAAYSQDPMYLAAIAGRPAIRSLILSKPYQRLFTNPSNPKPSNMLRLGSQATNSPMLRQGAVLGVPAYTLSQNE